MKRSEVRTSHMGEHRSAAAACGLMIASCLSEHPHTHFVNLYVKTTNVGEPAAL